MEDILESLRGLFEGGNFPNAQINILPGDGVHVSYEGSKNQEKEETPIGNKTPSFDEMMQIFKKAKEDGLWNSMRCWGVGYQLYQIWGYKGTPQDFVRLAQNSPDILMFDYPCNDNAIYKMMSKGHLSRHLENWRHDGVLECYCLLGDLINNELLKLYPPIIEDSEEEED